MSKKKVKTEEELAPNLIPMIDIMFLLLLFFMLGADMGQRELEEVKLPECDAVKEEKDNIKSRVTVNVYHAYSQELKCSTYKAAEEGDDNKWCMVESHWRIGVRGHDYTKETIKGLLQMEADLERPEKDKPSERRVMIRADKAALYGFVQKVMNACAEVGIYKVEVAAAEKMKE